MKRHLLLLFFLPLSLLGTSVPSPFTVEVVVRHLEIPWALDFAPDGRLFFTERPGRIQVLDPGASRPRLVGRLTVAHEGEGGLLGVALDRDFSRNGRLYAYYTYREGERLWNRVVRLTQEKGGILREEEGTVIDRIPGARIHNGGRIKIGPDGRLYITTGDAANPPLAQDLTSLAGKILRINPDGSIPGDNPFPGSPVYSLGHRNPQGLAWHSVSRALFITEHGPIGHDEVNLVQPGKNYGWPHVAGSGGGVRFLDPILESGQGTWAPSGTAVYRSDLFFAALRG
ncbi:MAG: PQQ-dependent sugar dehydrogenase, partial [candidate division NC10 bacterium]|nr:PQQ-dependent sugar dehydrogenase [candidate division NC10 bacterium]